jgi:dipeptidyl aminopeptidase/acylaminoacyl peptidase
MVVLRISAMFLETESATKVGIGLRNPDPEWFVQPWKGEICVPYPFLIAVALAASVLPQEPPVGARPLPLANVRPVKVPDFDAERGLQWSSTREEYEAARADANFIFAQFSYESDGLVVGAYLYRPKELQGRRWPAIVYNRGGFTRPDGFAGEMLVMANRFARAGFVVVAPHYRGSNGSPGRDELGGADLNDLMNIVPQLPRIEGVDTTRVFLAGESRGGAMVYQAIRDRFPARAAAVWGAFTDLAPLTAPGGPQANVAAMLWSDLEQNRSAIVERRSAVRWASRLDTPVLIMHGGADEDIPIEQSQRLAAELTRLGKTHRFVTFDGQQHRIGGRGSERDAATVDWFRRFGAN